MSARTPSWWYQKRPKRPAAAVLLKPLSWVWRGATARRIARGAPYAAPVPVVCVGNLTVGGAGKTPVAREIARRVGGAHILSRGYGGRLAGPVQVDPQVHTSAEVGDEPLMLAQDHAVWVARDRAAGARAATRDGAQVIVMDDGHQNPSLKKNLTFVVVDGETRDGEWPFGDGAVFPYGPMREPLESGLARADAVVVMLPADLGAPDPELLDLFGDKPVFVARLEPTAKPPKGPLAGFAGIAKPWKFERGLKAAGAKLIDFTAFADHAAYDEATLTNLATRAAAMGARLVTTEKDWVRLPPAWRDQIYVWPVCARFDDARALDRFVKKALA
jgi:tetraacyldisaccharide 4'-kinase